MAEERNPKIIGFWKNIDEAFLMLAQIAFEQCWTQIELREAGEKTRFVLDVRYPNNPGKKELQTRLKALYQERYAELERINTVPMAGDVITPKASL